MSGLFNFSSFPLWGNAGIFLVVAGVVWYVGTYIAEYADAISDKTNLGKAFVGALLLAVATSSPEMATVATASLTNSPALAINNLFGGITMQTAILAVVDLLILRVALTAFAPRPVLMLQGVLLIILLNLSLTAFIVGDFFSMFGVGIWPVLLFGAYLVSLYISENYEKNERWQPKDDSPEETAIMEAEKERTQQNEKRTGKLRERGQAYRKWSLTWLLLYFGGGTLIILLSGTLLTLTGDALATQTGLGASFVGVTLLAIATSLPEVSTTITSARLGNYSMAISNIFGSNALMVALLLLADILYREGPILNTAGIIPSFAAATGVLVTAIYMVGMIERKDRTIWRLGIDSAVVLVVYMATLVGQYMLR